MTGGGSGIGKAIARSLVELECSVVIAGRNPEKLSAAAEELSSGGGGPVQHCICNIRDEENVRKLMRFAMSERGGLDLLVNNAGGQFSAPASKTSLKGWEAVIDTNLTSTFLCCREAYAAGMKTNGGAIANIIAGMFNGFPGMAHTGAARAAVDNLTKSLALEWASSGVRVNAVAPGVIYSETAAKNYDEAGEFLRSLAPQLPPQRLGTPEEVAAAVTFLLSPGAQYISGATLRVDAGSSLYQPSPLFKIRPHDSLPVLGTE